MFTKGFEKTAGPMPAVAGGSSGPPPPGGSGKGFLPGPKNPDIYRAVREHVARWQGIALGSSLEKKKKKEE